MNITLTSCMLTTESRIVNIWLCLIYFSFSMYDFNFYYLYYSFFVEPLAYKLQDIMTFELYELKRVFPKYKPLSLNY